jgi:preprotein translocase subunit SecE
MAFEIYKPNQGKYTRLYSAFGASLVAGIGCYQLYNILQGTDLGLWVQIMVPASAFVVLSVFFFWFVNRPTVADFMVTAENEMKKVNWSSRGEIIASTLVVIVVVIILAALLGVTDFIFQLFFMWLLL